jgi:uridine kinase
MLRNELIEQLGSRILSISLSHPTRVGIDGIDASGKTRLADELAEFLTSSGRQIIRSSVDGFHHPKAHRLRNGEGPDSYYYDSHNYPLIVESVLAPLGPGGSRRVRVARFDFRTDSEVDSPEVRAEDDAILLMDGIFLQRPELFDHWDLRIFLHTEFDTSLQRGLERDTDLFGSGDKTISRYKTRYVPGQKLYLDQVRPHEIADIGINNDDWRNPILLR